MDGGLELLSSEFGKYVHIVAYNRASIFFLRAVMHSARCIGHVLLPAVWGACYSWDWGGRCQICVFLASLPRLMSEGSTLA